MCRETREGFVCGILTAVLASGVTTATLAQTNVLPIGSDEIEVQVKQQWKDSEARCEKYNQAKIDRVDIISNHEFKNWLMKRHSIYGDRIELLPKGNYVRVASSMENIGDGITVFGPVYTTLRTTDFRAIIGLQICNQREFKK
jgi:hypothetical protein